MRAGQNFKPVSIAVTPFAGDDGADKIGSVVANDFARSIFLLPLNASGFPETVTNPDQRPNVDAWKNANAQFVLTGRVLKPDGEHVTAQFRLWDVATGEQVAGEQYTSEASNTRRVAHMISDSVFSRVTGEKGFSPPPNMIHRADPLTCIKIRKTLSLLQSVRGRLGVCS